MLRSFQDAVDVILTKEDVVQMKILVWKAKVTVMLTMIVSESLFVETIIARLLEISSMRKMIVVSNLKSLRLYLVLGVVDVILTKGAAVPWKIPVLKVRVTVKLTMIVVEILFAETIIAKLLDLSSMRKMIAV